MDVDEWTDFEETVYNINPYLLLIESIEKITLPFTTKSLEENHLIQGQLQSCCDHLNDMITNETDHNHYMALCEQKRQLDTLLFLVKKIQDRPQPKKAENKQLPLYPNAPKANQESIIQDSKQLPRLKGLDEIVGLEETKNLLRSLILLPKTQPQLFNNVKICNSILLYGPPGTGKTCLVHALAAEAKATFHSVSSADILSHYVGQSEKNIKTLFEHLRQSADFTVLFLDEVDAFCRKRTGREEEYSRRIKTEIMCEMSSIENCEHLVVICATNCPWDLDCAILRRFQKRIYVPLPSDADRLDILHSLTKDSLELETNPETWNILMRKTHGYSGSDLHDLIQTARQIPLNELQSTTIWKCLDDGCFEPLPKPYLLNLGFRYKRSSLSDLPPHSVKARKLQLRDVLSAADAVKSTVSKLDIIKYDYFNA